MRIKIAFAAITAATLSVVLFTGCDPSAPDNQPHPYGTSGQQMPEECLVLYGQPPYDVRYEDGTVVHVPAGRVLVDELLGEETETLRVGCLKIRQQWIKDHRNAQPSGWTFRTDFAGIAEFYSA